MTISHWLLHIVIYVYFIAYQPEQINTATKTLLVFYI